MCWRIYDGGQGAVLDDCELIRRRRYWSSRLVGSFKMAWSNGRQIVAFDDENILLANLTSSQVILTDVAEALPMLRHNITLNGLDLQCCAEVCEYDLLLNRDSLQRALVGADIWWRGPSLCRSGQGSRLQMPRRRRWVLGGGARFQDRDRQGHRHSCFRLPLQPPVSSSARLLDGAV